MHATVNLFWNENIMSLDGERNQTVEVTTEHSAASYGMPVVVDGDGNVLGPSDLPAHSVLEFAKNSSGHTIDRELREAASRAGFQVI